MSTLTILQILDRDLEVEPLPTERELRRVKINSIRDARLLRAVLVLGMEYPDAHDYAGFECKEDRSKSATVSRSMRKLSAVARMWLTERGLTKESILLEWLDMSKATETKFFQSDGVVTDQRDVINWGARKSALENITKMMGWNAPEKHELSVNPVKKLLEEIDGTSNGLPS